MEFKRGGGGHTLQCSLLTNSWSYSSSHSIIIASAEGTILSQSHLTELNCRFSQMKLLKLHEQVDELDWKALKRHNFELVGSFVRGE